MKKMLFILIMCSFCFPIFGQTNVEGLTVSKGKISTINSEVIEGQYIVFSSDSVEYYLKNSKVRNVLNLDQVTKVQQYDGHYGNTGMWIGGIAGCGLGVMVALETKETTRTGYIEETTIQTWPIYVFTAAGTLLGYLIGSASEDWDTVYSSDMSALLKNIYVKQNKVGNISLGYIVKF